MHTNPHFDGRSASNLAPSDDWSRTTEPILALQRGMRWAILGSNQ